MLLSEPFTNPNGRDGSPGCVTRSTEVNVEFDGDDRATRFLRNSSSLQSMLRNTTETGDVGEFSIKPSRLPHPTWHKARYLSELDQHHPMRRSYSRHYRPTQSSNKSYQTSKSPKSRASPYQSQNHRLHNETSDAALHDLDRSQLVVQGSSTTSNPPNPRTRSIDTGNFQGNIRVAQSSSPYVYPTRLRRPGYRSASPAVNDPPRVIQGTNLGTHQETTSQTSSPMSIYSARRTATMWQMTPNQLDSSSQYYLTPQATNHSKMKPLTPCQNDTFGTVSTFKTNPNLFPSQESLAPTSSPSFWTSRQSLSPSPIFYDYTEAFEDTGHFQMSTRSLTDQVIPEHYPAIHLAPSIDFSPSEYANETLSSFSSKEQSHEDSDDDVTVDPEPSGNTRPVSEPEERWNVTKNSYIIGKTESKSEKQRTSTDSGQIMMSATRQPSLNSSSTEVRGHFTKPLSRPRVQSSSFALSSLTMSHSNTSFVSAVRSLSPNESMYSVNSLSGSDRSIHKTHLENPSKPSPVQKKLSSNLLNKSSDKATAPIEGEDLVTGLSTSHEKPFDRWPDGEPTQIYAPRPERSISSPSHRERFSRIINISEGSLRIAEITLNSDQAQSQVMTMEQAKGETTAELIQSITPNSNCSSSNSQKIALSLRQSPSQSRWRDEEERTQTPGRPAHKSQPTDSMNNASTQLMYTVAETTLGNLTSDSLRKTCMKKQILQDTLGNNNEKDANPAMPLGLHQSTQPISPSHEKIGISRDPKDYPLFRSKNSFRACTPPATTGISSLPCAFAPLLRDGNEDNCDAAVSDASRLCVIRNVGVETSSSETASSKHKSSGQSADDTTQSTATSYPWNLDISYPWTDQQLELQVAVPESKPNVCQNENKPPKFKLKVQRASLSTTGSTKLSKQPPANLEFSAHPKTSISSDVFCPGAFIGRPRPSITLTQNNSSHMSPVRPQVVQMLDSSSGSAFASPTISLVPPSPGLNLEVGSSFSDDSSQLPPRGSLRKRISQLKAIAVKNGSSTDANSADRGLLTSVMGKSKADSRNGNQRTVPSERMYNLKHVRWRIKEKLRDWFHRGEEKFSGWGKKLAMADPRDRTTSEGLYTGV